MWILAVHTNCLLKFPQFYCPFLDIVYRQHLMQVFLFYLMLKVKKVNLLQILFIPCISGSLQ